MLSLSVPWITALVGVFIPLLVGVLTKSRASKSVKTISNLALSALAAGLTVAIRNDGLIRVSDWVLNVLLVFGTSLIAHYNLWKPTGITEKVVDAFPDTGIGQHAGPLDGLHSALAWLGTLGAAANAASPVANIFFGNGDGDLNVPPPTGDPVVDAPPPTKASDQALPPD